jgi:hypothetical protein
LDEDTYGIRIFSTADVDAVLQRADIQRGYTLVIWRGRHVVEPFELTESEAQSYWKATLTVAKALATFYRPLKTNYETLETPSRISTRTYCRASSRIPLRGGRSSCCLRVATKPRSNLSNSLATPQRFGLFSVEPLAVRRRLGENFLYRIKAAPPGPLGPSSLPKGSG